MQAQINGQPQIDWLPATAETQGVYPGEVGKTYVSLADVQAMDGVGRLSDWVGYQNGQFVDIPGVENLGY